MQILIVGANGGIGLAMVQQAITQFDNVRIYATYHRNQPDWSHPWVTWYRLDASRENEVEALSLELKSIDWVINCAGILHSRHHSPEKSLNALDADFFQHNLAVNTLPTVLLAKYFTATLKRSPAPKFASLSAKVGSISDNQLGGWYSYRVSKAALNMFLKTMSIEWRRTVKHGVVLALHPGTTNTRLSAPFQSNVPEGKLFTPKRVAADLISLIDKSTPDDSGAFWAYDGEILPW
ncbi:SDR family oxidoreductase [Vibrio sp.]|uniref:SDR family oxidoreductase n=1 Tax=Vibrio sp. TaxID=678 RepID=UPI003D0EE18D